MPLSASDAEKLLTQFEFYFSDVNLVKDVHLKSLMAQDPEGFVPLVEFVKFKRVAALTKDVADMAEALKPSTKVVVNESTMAVRRAAPLPESISTDDMTVYVKPVPPTATLEELHAFFGQFGKVQAVWRRYFSGGSKDDGKGVKPSVFVVFGSAAEAEAFVASPPKFGADQLIALPKLAYLEEKTREFNSKKSEKKGGAAAASGPKITTPPMPRNASYKVHGVGEIAHFADVKNLWGKAEQSGIRYVFMPDKETCLIIFQDEETGRNMVAELEKKGTTLNGKAPQVTRLEGADEDALISSVDKEIADRAAKRQEQGGGGRGGRGGRGGGRGGRGRGGRGQTGSKRERD